LYANFVIVQHIAIMHVYLTVQLSNAAADCAHHPIFNFCPKIISILALLANYLAFC